MIDRYLDAPIFELSGPLPRECYELYNASFALLVILYHIPYFTKYIYSITEARSCKESIFTDIGGTYRWAVRPEGGGIIEGRTQPRLLTSIGRVIEVALVLKRGRDNSKLGISVHILVVRLERISGLASSVVSLNWSRFQVPISEMTYILLVFNGAPESALGREGCPRTQANLLWSSILVRMHSCSAMCYDPQYLDGID
ncbi:hypothetical protein BDN72DRAFT_331855 [Pluteus cervinus]|uniref:Uncharacterized protein n=1 Tax=Pluteus cervinus TaxID=181527 RepID=A0ACD3AC56_9AGAR|nr:hypothetical protein BDN72DRAFT_331855 [Pluteus cervinus]